jgi:squalene cyclase
MSAKRLITLVVLLSFLLPSFSVAGAQSSNDLDRAVSWLVDQQQADGGFSNGLAPESDIGTTSDAIFALVFAGEDPSLVKSGGKSPIDFLEEHTQSGEILSTGVAAKIVLALNVAGLDPRSFAGQDLVQTVQDGYEVSTGLFGFGPFDSSLAILALAAVDADLPEGAIEGLLSTRLEDGSFSFNAEPGQVTGDSNTTALAVQALVSVGAEDEIKPTLDYFQTTQNEDGGWAYQKPSEFGEETDANSTALVIQALDAAGEALVEWRDPLKTLASLQREDGAFGYSATFPDANILATIQAIPTLVGGTYVESITPSYSQEKPFPSIVIGTSILIILILVGAFIGARLRKRE